MLRLASVTKNYGAREVLNGLDWAVPVEARVGLVGRNGSGKTTLLRIIAGEEEADAGAVERPRGVTFGYLPQEGARVASGTVLEALLAGFPEIASLERELAGLHESMASARGAELDALTRRAGEAQHRLEAAGGFRIESEARRILTGLGFSPADHARPLSEFSGGYRMRAALGTLLLKAPTYLLLDEPTNHLDLDAVAWLESFLAESPSALIVVSHDRAFLNRLATSIADLDRGQVTVYPGNYDTYRVAKEAARERLEKAAAQEAHRVAEVERFIERFRYKATKARQVQSRIKMLEKMPRTTVDAEERVWRFELPPAPRCGALVARLAGVTKAFDGRQVLGAAGRAPGQVDGGLDFDLHRGERVALVGPNGSGKSTLLKIIALRLAPDAGIVELGDKVVMHYVSQHVIESLTSGRTVLEEMQAAAPDRTPGALRSLLGIFQFSGDDAFKPIDVLSGGEKNRLALARLMLDPGNLLLLDEPTNHLDLPAREALESALARYDGALIFVSHDRYFINKVATRVASLESGRLALHDGGWDDWRAARQAASVEAPGARAGTPSGPGPASEADRPARTREQKRAEAEARNERSRALKQLKNRVASIEQEIAKAEARRDEVEAALADAATYRNEAKARALGEERKSLFETLSRLGLAWEQAMAACEEMEKG